MSGEAHLASYILDMLPLHLGLTGIVLAVILASFLSAGLLLGRFCVLARRG